MKLSKGAQKIFNILKAEHILFKIEYEFNNLKGKNDTPLRYDFALLNKTNQPRILIEFDGEAHFKQVKFFQKQSSDFKRAQERDRQKNKYALLHNIQLYRIPYWEIDNISTFKDLFNPKFKVKNKYHNDYLKAP